MQNVTHFLLLELGVESSSVFADQPHLASYLSRAQRTSLPELSTFIENCQVAKETPIICVCIDGRQSAKAARKLEQMGYLNVYLLNGGVKALVDFFC